MGDFVLLLARDAPFFLPSFRSFPHGFTNRILGNGRVLRQDVFSFKPLRACRRSPCFWQSWRYAGRATELFGQWHARAGGGVGAACNTDVAVA